MRPWQAILKSLGLSESEAKVYLMSLELGPSSVQDIAKKANVSRVTTYAAIESLMQQGLMSTVHKGKKNLFSAESPERLLSFVRARMDRMESTIKEVKESIDELKFLERGEKPIVKMFEGVESYKGIAQDMMDSNTKHLYEFANGDAIAEVWSDEFADPYREELAKRKIKKTKIIHTKELESTASKNSEVIFLPQREHPFYGNVTVYNDKVAFMSLRGKPLSVLIQNQNIADMVLAMMENMWDSNKNKYPPITG